MKLFFFEDIFVFFLKNCSKREKRETRVFRNFAFRALQDADGRFSYENVKIFVQFVENSSILREFIKFLDIFCFFET